MKKLICPTDFSNAANNAIEYASKLAQKLEATIEILNFQTISPASPIASGISARENRPKAEQTLENICNEVSKTFNIFCRYKSETTTATLERAINSKAARDNIIVMGTNGIDDSYQYIFGTNTYHVIKKSKCPVWVIPEDAAYKDIKKVVFAWDYSQDNHLSFLQLETLLGIFNPEITMLHISKQKTPISDDVYRALQEEIYNTFGEKENIRFDRIYSDDPDTFAEITDNYIHDSQADLLAVSFYDRGVLRNIFHGTLVKDLSEIADYPLLVMHV